MGDSDEKKKVDNIIVDDEKKKVNPFSEFDNDNSTYKSVEDFLTNQINSVKQESEEDKAKRLRRDKRNAFIAGIGDALGSFHKAYSRAAGVEPVNVTSLSDKMQARMERAKAMRQQNKDRLFNYYQNLYKVKDNERNFRFGVTQAEQQQNNWQQQFDAGRKDRADDVEFRNKNFDTDNERWQKSFDENQRQFNVTAKEHERHNRISEGLDRQRIAASQDGKYTEFYSGNGMVRIPNTRLNQHNISYVFSKTPSAGRPKGGYNKQTGQTTPVSADQMMDWIGSNIDNPNVQRALRAIGGVTTTADNTPPSRRSNNNNVPPSRR